MCCGRNRSAASGAGAPSMGRRIEHRTEHTGAGQRDFMAYFEYTGRTGMTVRGPVSGATYRFAAPGSRVAVDLRDRLSLAALSQLRQVNSL
ncbi:MAG: hypothetical protein LAP21_26295 [Acidobacteriia bacterium]|nr:hypothetical protein [Terriglobia bacterium]